VQTRFVCIVVEANRFHGPSLLIKQILSGGLRVRVALCVTQLVIRFVFIAAFAIGRLEHANFSGASRSQRSSCGLLQCLGVGKGLKWRFGRSFRFAAAGALAAIWRGVGVDRWRGRRSCPSPPDRIRRDDVRGPDDLFAVTGVAGWCEFGHPAPALGDADESKPGSNDRVLKTRYLLMTITCSPPKSVTADSTPSAPVRVDLIVFGLANESRNPTKPWPAQPKHPKFAHRDGTIASQSREGRHRNQHAEPVGHVSPSEAVFR